MGDLVNSSIDSKTGHPRCADERSRKSANPASLARVGIRNKVLKSSVALTWHASTPAIRITAESHGISS
jgi:hypothetical protein